MYRYVVLPFSPHAGAGIALEGSQEQITFVNTHFNAQKQELESVVWCKDDLTVANKGHLYKSTRRDQIEVIVQQYEEQGWTRNLGDSWG